MRAPAFGAPTTDLYAAALEMSNYADEHGAVAIVVSEHHGTVDGHLPTPLLLASAIAARTKQVGIVVAAIVLPFCDPVRLAEEMCVLDIISQGRVIHVIGVGHRAEEYEHFGLDIGQRGATADEKLALLIGLLRDPEVVDGPRTIRVTPRPTRPQGPTILIGGASIAAAERAGRFGLGILAQAEPPGLRETYQDACRANGHRPGHVQLPDPHGADDGLRRRGPRPGVA